MQNHEGRRPYFELSNRQKIRNKQKIIAALKLIERNVLATMNLKLHLVKISELNNENNEDFSFEIKRNYESTSKAVNVFTKIKDDLNISDKGYVHLSHNLDEAPSLYRIKKDQERINQIFENLIKTNDKGYYIDVEYKIKFVLFNLVDQLVFENNIP
jgi:hypothetical protein